jgi:hypothetical protein
MSHLRLRPPRDSPPLPQMRDDLSHPARTTQIMQLHPKRFFASHARCAPLTKNPTRPARKSRTIFHAIPPAIPPLIKIRCAPVITKAHHPASLTEGDDARRKTDAPTDAAGSAPRSRAHTNVRASRTPCYKMLQPATRNCALFQHHNPPRNPWRLLACSASWRSAFPLPHQNPQNEPMCHLGTPAKTRQSAPNASKLLHPIAPGQNEPTALPNFPHPRGV